MNIVLGPHVARYLEELWPPADAVLARVEREAESHGIPSVGPGVGRLLEQLARFVGARRVIELGSGVGYSGAWIARGMQLDGEIHLTDDTPEFVEAARENMRELGFADMATVHLGDALEVFQRLQGEFDIVFTDCGKQDYPRAFELARPRVRRGGLLVADNVLWGGRVADPKATDPDTTAIREYNRLVTSDAGLVTTIVPIRDGVAVSLVL